MTADQYTDPPFGLSKAIAQTGAPGSPGVQASQTFGPVIGNPVISLPGFSSQLPEGRPTLPVAAGDTCSSSADAPVPGMDPLTGLSLADVTQTGAGQGTVVTPHHPGAGSRA
jgi:hypothetical protein